ncbi:MAG: hypothetical protein WC214_03555, partial [Candidatus Omnitrophota bacterium]
LLESAYNVNETAAPVVLADVKGVVYITGIGCSNCAIVDPFLFSSYMPLHRDVALVEYEIYRDKDYNASSAEAYFKNYIDGNVRVPVLIFEKNKIAIGRTEILDIINTGFEDDAKACPLPDGRMVGMDKLDFSEFSGKIKVFFRDRLLYFDTSGADNELIKKLLYSGNLQQTLETISYQQDDNKEVAISRGRMVYPYAVKIGDMELKWGKSKIYTNYLEFIPKKQTPANAGLPYKSKFWGIATSVLFFITVLFSVFLYKIWKIPGRIADWTLVLLAVLFISSFVLFALSVPGSLLKDIGYSMPLPIFTLCIALVDGVNPCNLFVLTFLLAMLVSVSDKREKIYTIGFLFVIVVFFIYFLFMMAWLATFKIFGFIGILRKLIAVLAIIAGIINCKELLFFRKGVTLMVQDKHKGPLFRRVGAMKHIIQNGSWPVIVFSSMTLAAFASFVELPCTAGFPMIYVKILADKFSINSAGYLSYILLYNFIYVMPLIFIVSLFGWTFRAKQISQRQIEIIKFFGGLIMILLGILLLVNPVLLGVGV